ncbi:hypothetical protein [Kingella oralis]|jgi:hypothetical protein|uniref:Uncharacterized protein n=2 Tax=Kingella TaxID=32257 RepID=C4GK84_9NEIS|nr:hypothetical protein [Kingella oralis]EEP68206.1 hypothetical protein GCWU000324_02458 [Kingella oralis ATCC 51147]QMT43080.1 hypothetical protein H3L93_01610 [Kingella oralis]
MMKTTRCLGEWFFLVLGCLDDLGQPETQYPMERRRLANILATMPFGICHLATSHRRSIFVFRLPLGAHQRQPENQSPQLKTTCHTTKPFPFSGCRSQ